jgi:hypothetical protein
VVEINFGLQHPNQGDDEKHGRNAVDDKTRPHRLDVRQGGDDPEIRMPVERDLGLFFLKSI